MPAVLAIGSGSTDELSPKLRAQLGECAVRERAVCDLAIITGEPRFTDFLSEFAIRVDGRQIDRSPGARIEERRHQQWVELAHTPKMFLFRYSLRNVPWESYFLQGR